MCVQIFHMVNIDVPAILMFPHSTSNFVKIGPRQANAHPSLQPPCSNIGIFPFSLHEGTKFDVAAWSIRKPHSMVN